MLVGKASHEKSSISVSFRFSFPDDDTVCHLMSISLRTATTGLRDRRIKKGCEINDADQKGTICVLNFSCACIPSALHSPSHDRRPY